MNLKGIGIYLTYQCNARCAHCAYGSDPRLKGVIHEAEVEEVLRTINQFGRLEVVKILGGEPTLHMVQLLRTVELARVYGASKVILITSGWWGKDEKKARKIALDLKEAGLSLMLISTDSYHTEYIPFEDVKGAIRAAQCAGMSYCATVDFLQSIDGDNPYDRRSRALFQQLQDMGIPIFASKISFVGRAAEFLAPFHQASLRDEGVPNQCQPPYAGSFENPSGIAIDPLGYVTLCHGIAIGNTRQKPLATILSEYDLERHPILRTVTKEGPLGLTKLEGAQDFQLKKTYVSSCQLCYEIRKHLRNRYPEYLAPGNCYEEPAAATHPRAFLTHILPVKEAQNQQETTART